MKKMISWNVNGLRACVGKGFLDVFHELDADIFCIQESKLQEGQIDLELPGYYQYWSYAEKKGYSGTALFSKEEPISVSYGLGIEKHDHEGRVITAEYPDYYVVTCYTPNSQNELARLPYRMQWEDDFRQFLKKLEEKKPVIFCGDLNVAHTEIDLKNPKTNRKMPDLRMRREASLRSFWTLDISTRTAIFTRIKRAFIPGGRTGLRRARRMLGGGLIISVFPRA